jgi:hypothetical protein
MTSISASPPRLLDQLRAAARTAGHNEATVEAFAARIVRFILFHDKRHPRELGPADLHRFLEHVVRTEPQPLPALECARAALALLYRDVLGIRVGELPRPRPPRLLDQVRQVMRLHHYALSTETCYVAWIERFIRHHHLRHPRDLGPPRSNSS